jgi:hypothetical protein
MIFDGSQVKEEFEKAFGFPVDKLDAHQLWWIVKVIKHCRQRCRNNSALNNWLNRNFNHANFKQAPKYNTDGSVYEGLIIQTDQTSCGGDDSNGSK